MPWNASPQQPATPRARASAKPLRRTLTEPERRLWWHLRHRLPVAGSHFRRQVPLGSYVADFCCFAARLVVEVDGGQHGREADVAYDARRTAALEAQGFRVLRFSNADVMRSIEAVLDTIFSTMALSNDTAITPPSPAADAPSGTTPTSNSSPQGGGARAAEP